MAYSALREVVERVVDEARKLPGLGNPDQNQGEILATQEGQHNSQESTQRDAKGSDKIYEDLLASAILHKVRYHI